MWVIDLGVQKYRGFAQGYHRGLYKDYDWELTESCLSKESVKQLYYIQEIFAAFEWTRAIDITGLLFNMYHNVDTQCTLEDTLYDLANFCFDHDCSPEQLLQNELAKVFQVTGALNSLAAIFYDEAPFDDEHALWFDFYNEVGLNVGKMFRWTLAFDPAEIRGRYQEDWRNQ